MLSSWVPDRHKPPCSPALTPNLKTLCLLIPRCSRVQFHAEPLHGCNNGLSLGVPGTPCLECVNDCRIKQKPNYSLSICFNNKNKTLIISLPFINGIIVNTIACAIQDGFPPVELYPSNHMAGMAKDHISACIN
jgi:hypothetical protein